VVGGSKEREPEVATCVRMACVEDVTRAQRATGRPGEPSHLGFFAPVTVDG
jgi:hypothetical protein